MLDIDKIILKKISENLHKPEKAIRRKIGHIARKENVSPPAALVHLAHSLSIGTGVYQKKLNRDQKMEIDKLLSKNKTQTASKLVTQRNNGQHQKKIIKLINYETTDPFKKGHIEELHRTYTYGCYTAVFILARKIVENLIIDIFKKNYPENTKENKELYFNIKQNQYHNFDKILENLKSKCNDFGTNNKGVERLCTLAKELKNKANDKAHSWYHLVKKKKEIDDLNLQQIIDIIISLEKFVKLR
jgi:hypothetical protein